MMKSAREDIVLDDNTSKEKGGQPAFKWLKEYAWSWSPKTITPKIPPTMSLPKVPDALPSLSTLKMVVGFSGSSRWWFRRARAKKETYATWSVPADHTSVAVMGIENADGTRRLPMSNLPGNRVSATRLTGSVMMPQLMIGWYHRKRKATVECPIARAEPVARTLRVPAKKPPPPACRRTRSTTLLLPPTTTRRYAALWRDGPIYSCLTPR